VRVLVRPRCVALLLSVAVGSCRSGDNRTPPPGAVAQAIPATKDSGVSPRTLLFIGTSITAGYGLDPAAAWTSLVQRRIDAAGLPFRAVNAGVSGESSAGALRRIDWLLAQEPKPSLVMIETGANDGLRGQPVDSVRANLEAIVRRIEATSPRPVIVIAGMEALPNLGRQYADRFRAIFPEIARAHGAVYLPFLLAGVAGIDTLNQGDGVHPNPAGSVRVAENVWHTLQPILDSLVRSGH
jgi:acyl-CoA thioesterase-1